MTASKRPDLLNHWIEGLRAHLRANLPRAVDEPSIDACSDAFDAWGRIPEGDRKLFAVATCLYKLASFRDELPSVEQRSSEAPRRFRIIDVKTGRDTTDYLAGTGLPELVKFPKRRWFPELRIATVLRLHRAGFRPAEIAKLLPSEKQPTAADSRRTANTMAELIRKYRHQAREHDLAYTPAHWSLRV